MNTAEITRKLRHKRYDLPLHRGSGGRLVAWIVGVMSYLTILMMVVVFALSAVQHYWQAGLMGRMTVEIPYSKTDPVSEETLDRLVSILNGLEGITAHKLSEQEIGNLVGPWLGTGAALEELPLPELIDVTRADNDTSVSISEIKSTVKEIIPTAALDTHEEWLADLMRLAKACRMILIAISLILAITAAVTVAATARTRLALHKAEVDLLHLIGATDGYIATQFQRQAFRLATEGAAGGLVLALLTMLVINFAKSHLGDAVTPQFHLSWWQWLCLVLTPLLAGLIAMIASRFTVLHALKRMP